MSEPNLYGRRKYWAKRFGPAPVLPMSRKEMDDLAWDSCDIIIVSGDAYVDHPSFGMALIGPLPKPTCRISPVCRSGVSQ